jgi:hypothetical protein
MNGVKNNMTEESKKKISMIFRPEHIDDNEGIIIQSHETQPFLQEVGRIDKLCNPKRYEREQRQRIEDEKRVIANTEVLFKMHLKNNKKFSSPMRGEKAFWDRFDANLKQMQSKEPVSIAGCIFATLKNKLQHCIEYLYKVKK